MPSDGLSPLSGTLVLAHGELLLATGTPRGGFGEDDEEVFEMGAVVSLVDTSRAGWTMGTGDAVRPER